MTKINSMEKEFLNYTEALELNKLGFDEDCLGHYEGEKLFIESCPKSLVKTINNTPIMKLRKNKWMLAPTFSQAFRWFREKYNLICRVDVTSYGCSLNEQEFYCEITSKNGTASYEIFNTYEEAELDCLKKLIEIVKEKQL
jgi:hypothetical protein